MHRYNYGSMGLPSPLSWAQLVAGMSVRIPHLEEVENSQLDRLDIRVAYHPSPSLKRQYGRGELDRRDGETTEKV